MWTKPHAPWASGNMCSPSRMRRGTLFSLHPNPTHLPLSYLFQSLASSMFRTRGVIRSYTRWSRAPIQAFKSQTLTGLGVLIPTGYSTTRTPECSLSSDPYSQVFTLLPWEPLLVCFCLLLSVLGNGRPAFCHCSWAHNLLQWEKQVDYHFTSNSVLPLDFLSECGLYFPVVYT